MRAFLSVCICLAFTSWGFAASGNSYNSARDHAVYGSLDQRWGPDAFGYLAIDSRDAEGPPVQWFDISATGTEVMGLADDNVVGPFPIGWDFRYYWYDISEFWVGSNGYIKFSTPGQLAQPIPAFPNAEPPNDVIGPYVADWFFGGTDPSRCYYWSNGTDTLIVMWKDVTAWGPNGNTGNHNFELVLSGVDSSITFFYGQQTGTVSNNNIAIGIENLTGQIGISAFFGAYPFSNFAIKFFYPDSVVFAVHDLAVAAVQNNWSAGFFLEVGDTLRPWLAVSNIGDQIESSSEAAYSIRQLNDTLLARRDTVLGLLNPMQRSEVWFPPFWIASDPGLFRASGSVTLADDVNPDNNALSAELHVVSIPGELAYDDGSSDIGWSWLGGQEGGLAMQFESPVYPCEIQQVRFYVTNGLQEGFTAQILDDDGPDGAPGTVLWSDHISNPASLAFAEADVPAGAVVIESGMFYVAWQQHIYDFQFGVDTTAYPGISRRAWEYVGGWSEFRMSQVADPMIRCSIRRPQVPNHPPGSFVRVAPMDSSIFAHYEAPFRMNWTRAADPDGDPVTYLLDLRNNFDSTMHFSTMDTSLANMLYPLWPSNIYEMSRVSWTVRATDGQDTVEAANGSGFFYIYLHVSVDETDLSLVHDYSLYSYPNPFNVSTEIRYDIPENVEAELKIYNLLGEEIETLFCARHSPGRYRARWDATDLPTGIYFAILSAGETTKLQKLLLIK